MISLAYQLFPRTIPISLLLNFVLTWALIWKPTKKVKERVIVKFVRRDKRDKIYKQRSKLIGARPSVRVHWVSCGTCTVPDNFFQVEGSLRPFKGSPRSHTSRGPLAHRSSHVRTTKQICPCVICRSNSARYCFGIVYHCSAMVEVLGK